MPQRPPDKAPRSDRIGPLAARPHTRHPENPCVNRGFVLDSGPMRADRCGCPRCHREGCAVQKLKRIHFNSAPNSRPSPPAFLSTSRNAASPKCAPGDRIPPRR